jgi:hypothetical protein
VALRYITTDRRIEIAWPCRVVQDSGDLLALFIAAGSRYKACPKRTAAQKLTAPRPQLPPDEYVWRHDALRLMRPGACHAVLLFWERTAARRRLLRYFINLEEPFRRTAVGFDTQDHTLDIVATPDLVCTWRDEDEFEQHVALGFYTTELAASARAEGRQVIDAFARKAHPCLRGWTAWEPDPGWPVPGIPASWATTPVTSWNRREWAYGAARYAADRP